MVNMNGNPFGYYSPDAISASDIKELFVTGFGELNDIINIGHTIIHGPRGTGKSMMFRFMNPDCMSLYKNVSYNELDFFSFYIPIKKGQFDKTDLKLLNNSHGENLLTEHIMIVKLSLEIYDQLRKLEIDNTQENREALIEYYNNHLKKLILVYGGGNFIIDIDTNTVNSIFEDIYKIFENIDLELYQSFILKLPFSREQIQYNGPIFLYREFLFEILIKMKELPFFPNKRIYLLIDDADNLSEKQTKILNSWIAMRTTKDVCIKLSTQLRYKTYRTPNNIYINTPHDYSEVNLSELYTSQRSKYMKKIEEIVEKRLTKFGYNNINVRDYFPPNKKQSEQIEQLFLKYHNEKGYDFAYRNATPDFMTTLKGNLNAYSYAGFDNLVNISSGIIRHFIDMAAKMYSIESSNNTNASTIEYISPTIQDTVIKEYSATFFESEFMKLSNDTGLDDTDITKYKKLKNLIDVMGQSFHVILFSDVTERRVFSFALSDQPSNELEEVLALGVELGYFHKSLIGNKNGTGKSRLYIMNRLLAPYFKLDPSSFAGYLFVRCSVLEEAICNPNLVISKVKRSSIDQVFDNNQLSLQEYEVKI